MALRTPLTVSPYMYIGDSTGRPLDYGMVYFGEPNKDPEFYPIKIFSDEDMTKPLAQPIRTKGGFMYGNGDMVEAHAVEVQYSVKVLDQYGRKILYKGGMFRNNVSDFLVDEITRATAAENVIATSVTTEKDRAIAAEKVVSDAVVTEKNRAVNAEGLIDAKAVALAAKDVELEGLIGSVSGGNVPYPTYAAMVADKANITTKMILEVMNDADQKKNGKYTYDGVSMFPKSAYDPAALSKVYADNNKLDYKEISYDYSGGNIIAPDTKVVVGKGYYSGLAYSAGGESESTILPVGEGEELYIFNDRNSYIAYDGVGNAFTAADPDLGASPPITDNRVFLVDSASSIRYMKVTVPVGAKFFVFNSKFNTHIKWSVQRDKFRNTYDVGEKELYKIKGAKIPKQISSTLVNELVSGNDTSGELYNPSGKVPKTYLGSGGVQDGNAYWSTYRFKVKAGSTYYIKITQPLSFPHMMIYTNSLSGGTGVTKVGFVTLQATTTDSLYTFTVPVGQGIVAVFMNLNISTDPDFPSYTYNVESTLSIQEGIYKKGALSKAAISSINGNTLIDSDLRAQFISLQSGAVTAKTRLTGKKVFALGDSMTAGYNGGYLKYLESAFGTSVINYGENAARSPRMVDILTAGSGIPLRNSVGDNTLPAKDITNVACVTLMIGTNDSDGAISSLAEMANLPSDTDNVYDYPDPLNYFAKFTNSYIGNIALCIEYIQWKSPTAEIHIIAPPHLYSGASGRARILQLQEPLKAICEKYSVHFINGTIESGISYKLMNPALGIFSTDSTHLTVAGNKLFGEYVAAKVLSCG